LIEKLLPESSGKVIGFRIRGKLSEADYTEVLVPIIEDALKNYPKVRILLQVENFQGWTVGGAWEDLRNWPKFRYIERMALASDQSWDEVMTWMLKVFASFTHTELRFFRMERLAEAKGWLREEP
jgi:hypothetical protein